MIIFALSLKNDVGVGAKALARMEDYYWEFTPTSSVNGMDTGLRIEVSDTQDAMYYLEPTTAVGSERYVITSFTLEPLGAASGRVPYLYLFGMPILENKDMTGVPLNGRGALQFCIVHDLDTGIGYGYINGRYTGSFTASRRLEIGPSPDISFSLSFMLTNLVVYSSADPEVKLPPSFIPVAIGENQTGWTVETTLAADLDKSDPYLEIPNVSSGTDGAKITVPANGRILVESAGLVSDGAEAVIKVQGTTLSLTSLQGPAKAVLVDAPTDVVIERVGTST